MNHSKQVGLEPFVEASHTKKVISGLIDASIALALVTFLLVNRSPEILYSLSLNVNPSLFVLLVFASYRWIALLVFNQTVGMKITGLIFLNGEERSLSVLERSLAAFFILFRGTDYYQAK